MDKKYYAGIGSREIEEKYFRDCFNFGKILAKKGFILRSGGAKGTDLAFEQGCDSCNGKKEIFVVSKNYGKNWGRNNLKQDIIPDFERSFNLFKDKLLSKHNDFDLGCNKFILKLIARNMNQILGENLDSPVDFVICYTKEGKEIGGTRWAIRLARLYNIPVFNLGK